MKAPTYSLRGAGRESGPAALLGELDATVWRRPACAKPRRLRSIASLAVVGVIALTLLAVLVPVARAAPDQGGDGAPQAFDTAACYQLVQDTGRLIAWARWELGAPENNVVARFDDGTPEWIVDLTNRWIEDAYHWEATDDQIRRWASELGDGNGSSPGDELTTPQTIAIWLHRIALQCHEQHT
jgi:hypothetical protein